LADGEMVMAAPRRVIEVSFSEKELSDLAWDRLKIGGGRAKGVFFASVL
jgi:hypothetical protein